MEERVDEIVDFKYGPEKVAKLIGAGTVRPNLDEEGQMTEN